MDFEQHSPLNIPHAKLTLILLKTHLKQFQEWQIQCFKEKGSINKIVALRSRYIDELLSSLWDKLKLNESYDLALIAVGGYGRGALLPQSDIDLLILSQNSFSKATEEKISALLLILWDLKLIVGHSARTLKDCKEQGEADIVIATSMIEARKIRGNANTFHQLKMLVQDDNFWPSASFFITKKEEQIARHHNCRGDGYSLEPDIKNGPGALRDIQTILWISLRHFKAHSLLELARYGYITQSEYNEIFDCQTVLWNMRFALHTITNRHDNRLLFDFQSDVAKLLAYEGEGNHAIEQMMKHFYKTIHRVKELNEMLLQYFDEAILGDNNSTVNTYSIDKHFNIKNHMIELKTTGLFKRKPALLLQLFFHIAKNNKIKGIYSTTLRELRIARRVLTVWLQDIPACRDIFMQIIHSTDGMNLCFSLMHKYGILAAYMPQWSQIVGQMQFDLFHAYTVDEHSHKLVNFIYNFPNNKESSPLAYKLSQKIIRPHVLFLAAIFHDIAKGNNGDHSKLGADYAREFCQLHNVNENDTELISWLVENHLILSVTAQRRDISDRAVIHRFAEGVQNEERLNLLYCLTVADICATNEDAWNNWKGTLLRDLHQSTKKLLRRGIKNDPNYRQRIKERKNKTLELLHEMGINDVQNSALWHNFRINYFLRYKSKQIVWHISHILKHHDKTKPLVLIGDKTAQGATEIFVYYKDMPALFSIVATEISNKKLTVHNAVVLSSRDNQSLTTFTVLEQDGNQVDPDKYNRLKVALENALVDPHSVKIIDHLLPRIKRYFKFTPKINYLSTKHNNTLLEIIAFDTPGILANIGHIFNANNLMINIAKITTIGERAEDLFIISTKDGDALNEDQKTKLETDLLKELKR